VTGSTAREARMAPNLGKHSVNRSTYPTVRDRPSVTVSRAFQFPDRKILGICTIIYFMSPLIPHALHSC
jgi:hypothetical protein